MISVIIPVYQSEKYLNRCIDSVLSQTYSELEVVLVDDGSKDDSGRICDQYANLDSRVKVLHKQNAGVAAARNIGLDIATGDYITFVDSDDYIEPDMYQTMMDIAISYDCDVVMCDCVKEFPNQSEKYTHDIRAGFYDKKQLREEYFPRLLMMENVEYPATISNWLCLFKRNLRSGRELPRYVEGVRFSEDLLFGAQLLYAADSFYYMKDRCFYHYCMNPDSATHTFTIDKWDDYVKLHNEIEKYFLHCKDFDFSHQVNLTLLFFVYNTVGNVLGAEVLSVEEKISLSNKILSNPKVKTMFAKIDIKKLPISSKLKIMTYMYKYRIGLKLLIEHNG